MSWEENGPHVGGKQKRSLWTVENSKELLRVVEEKKAGGKMPRGGWDEVAEHMRAYDGGLHKTSFNSNNCSDKYHELKPKSK